MNAIAALFRAQLVPVVYTPEDNEWTDCHRAWAGGFDPLECLARLREVFFGDETVLRLGELAPLRTAPGYPEIYYFRRGDLLFAALHVVGSNNGLLGANELAAAEVEQRNQANHALLTRLVAVAKEERANALVLFFHADPMFERPKPPKGLRPLRRDLIELMTRFPGPVLAIHGDGHRYWYDRPLIDPASGEPFKRFTRVEVPGSPVVGGVWVTVDVGSDTPFAVEPVYPVSADELDVR